MADGHVMTKSNWGVANKSMRFGTRCTFWFHGRVAHNVPVDDRGPFVPGRTFDLSGLVARVLGVSGVGTVRYICK